MISVLMVGTGEYTTGYVHGQASGSDKSAGVVALTMFDLRRRGMIDRILMAGTNGTKFPGIREHLSSAIGERYRDMDTSADSWPADEVSSDPLAYRTALASLSPGDVVAVFTPDDSHFQIAMDAIRQKCHVLVAKPLVKTVAEHTQALRRRMEELQCRFELIYPMSPWRSFWLSCFRLRQTPPLQL